MNPKEAISILLLEDDADDYQLLLSSICSNRRDFEVDRAETLAEAVEKLSQKVYDVILTDLTVPDSSGLATVSRLKEICGNAPVIAMTGLDNDSVEREVLAVGAQDFIVKGELGGRAVVRSIVHAVQRQKSLNEVHALVEKLEHSQELLQQHTQLLRKKNLRLKRLCQTAQDLVDNVSHDFRTPLTVIKDYVNIISEGMVGTINDKQRAMLEKVSVRADDLNIMVDDLLDVSKIESGLLGTWRRNARVAEILERVESMLRQRAETNGVEFEVECAADLPEIYCDADKVGRVITNLGVNAIKFAGRAGRVRLWVEFDPSEHQVVIGVTDNGPGIARESLQQIFERFRQLANQVKSPVKGFGLGLNIAQQLCRLNLGELQVQSEVGKGSTFSFSLPIANSTEIFRRWLKLQCRPIEHLKAIEIIVPKKTSSFAIDEFDSFLNCLLFRDDLLLHFNPTSWLIVAPAAPSDTENWFKRAKQEFKKANRNRPQGPLPPYRAVTRREWHTQDSHESIIEQVHTITKQRGAACAEIAGAI